MNRLVIIGNGFDLAHGLPTGYCDFINDYWLKVFNHIKNQSIQNIEYKDDFISLVVNFGYQYPQKAVDEFKTLSSFKGLMEFLKTFNNIYAYSRLDYNISFSNNFFGIINSRYSIQNWVDIENEYFKILKSKVTPNSSIKYSGNVQQLNNEFDQVKKLLEQYLNEHINSRFDFESSPENSTFLTELFDVKSRDNDLYLREFSYRDKIEVGKNLKEIGLNLKFNLNSKKRTMFVFKF